MPLILPNDIEPLTTADAAEVEQNYSVIEQYINAEVIVRNGSIKMTAPLTLYASPTQDQHAATKAYVDAMLPVGIIMPFGGNAAPEGTWALCNGAELQSANFPELYAVIGTKFGGTGGTFKLPDLRGRIPIGLDPTQTRFDNAGDTGGTWVVPVPQHLHSMAHNHGSFASGSQSASHTHSMTHNHGSVNTKSGDGEHNHSGRFSADLDTSAGPGWVARRAVDTTGTTPTTITVDGGGAHIHAVDLPQFTGDTGIQKVSHTHSVDVPNFTGNTANTGTANAEHLPPYVVLSYIIRTA